MTWEQEMKEQAHFLAEEWAPVMAQELAQDMAKNIAEEIAEEKVQESVLETARNMLNKNLPPQLVAECTNLPLEQVLQLQQKLTTPAAQ